MMELHEVQARLPDDHPLMIAWEEYRLTEASINTERWARTIKASAPCSGQIIVEHPYIVGSLWAVFEAGYKAAGGKV